MILEKFVKHNTKLKATHDNYKKVDSRLATLGFNKVKSFYESANGRAAGVNDGGVWEKDGIFIQTDYLIRFHDYESQGLEVKICPGKLYEKGKVLLEVFDNEVLVKYILDNKLNPFDIDYSMLTGCIAWGLIKSVSLYEYLFKNGLTYKLYGV